MVEDEAWRRRPPGEGEAARRPRLAQRRRERQLREQRREQLREQRRQLDEARERQKEQTLADARVMVAQAKQREKQLAKMEESNHKLHVLLRYAYNTTADTTSRSSFASTAPASRRGVGQGGELHLCSQGRW